MRAHAASCQTFRQQALICVPLVPSCLFTHHWSGAGEYWDGQRNKSQSHGRKKISDGGRLGWPPGRVSSTAGSTNPRHDCSSCQQPQQPSHAHVSGPPAAVQPVVLSLLTTSLMQGSCLCRMPGLQVLQAKLSASANFSFFFFLGMLRSGCTMSSTEANRS